MRESSPYIPASRSLLPRLIEIVLLAAVYYSTARLGQTLAIPPGNVTPVWIPSGIFLAAVLLRGYSIWPGIFLGAFLGNTWAYIDFSSFSNMIRCLFTGTANGVGDVLSAVGGAYLITRTTGTWNPFGRTSNVVRFVLYGALVGPAVSALFGVTTLCAAGFISWDLYDYTLLTWWTGDGVGALVIAPTILVWFTEEKRSLLRNRRVELFAFTTVLLTTSAYCLDLLPRVALLHLPLFSLAPVLIWAVFRLGQSITFSGVLIFSALSILVTATGHGPFSGKELNISLMELQWFLAVMSITIYVLSGVTLERTRAREGLQRAHNELDRKVKERTVDLSELNERLLKEVEVRRKAEQKKEETIDELRRALEEIKTLRGILPICAACKKIRDDKGYWNQIESYIRDRSEAEFSHGICPECAKNLYGEEA